MDSRRCIHELQRDRTLACRICLIKFYFDTLKSIDSFHVMNNLGKVLVVFFPPEFERVDRTSN